MKKSVEWLKRGLTVTVAAAMMVTSLPGYVFALENVNDDGLESLEKANDEAEALTELITLDESESEENYTISAEENEEFDEMKEQTDDSEMLNAPLKYISDGLTPRVYVETRDKVGNALVKKDGNVPARIVIIDVAANNNPDGTAKIVYEDDESKLDPKKDKTYSKFKVRGNSTAFAEKKGYNIKLKDKTDLFGMGKASKWCLLANFFDPTFFRNSIAFDMADEFGLEYTSKRIVVELFIDGKYKGLYLMTEAVEDGKTRVDIDTDKDDFMVEANAERLEDNVTYITTNGGCRYEMSAPDEDISEAKLSSVTKVLNDIEAVIKAGNFGEVKKVVDVDSFAKMYLLNEISRNCDFPKYSSFMYYKDGKLHAGPVWDYDLAFGNLNENHDSLFAVHSKTTGRLIDINSAVPSVYKMLLSYDEFNNIVKKLYKDKYNYICSLYADGGVIDNYALTYYARMLNSYKECGYKFDTIKSADSLERKPDSSYDANVQYFKKWLEKRNKWIHKAFITAGTRKDKANNIFKDLKPGSWYDTAVQYSYETGYMNGVGNNKFMPNSKCTRSQFVQIIYNMEDKPGGSATNPFKDVAKGKWYSDAVTWAVSKGVTSGTSADTFGLDKTVTREEAAQFFMNYAKQCGYDVSQRGFLDKYSDRLEVSKWAWDSGALTWATAVGVMSGYSDGRLGPKDPCTRAQIAQMVYNFEKKVVK